MDATCLAEEFGRKRFQFAIQYTLQGDAFSRAIREAEKFRHRWNMQSAIWR